MVITTKGRQALSSLKTTYIQNHIAGSSPAESTFYFFTYFFMKKLLTLILLSLALISCGKLQREDVETWDTTENKYYFKEVPEEWTLPPMEWATSFEILMQKDCWVDEKFDTQNNKIVFKSYDCFAFFTMIDCIG